MAPVPNNGLLASLPSASYESLATDLSRVVLRHGQVLQEEGRPFRHAYFPLSGCIGVLASNTDGRSVAILTIGSEGFAGLAAIGSRISPWRWVVCVDGEALRMDVPTFVAHVAADSFLKDAFALRLLAATQMIARAALCGRFHSHEQRCALMLLLLHDFAAGSTLPLTHEMLGDMLGAHRPQVSSTLERLHHDRIVEANRRGIIRILDATALRELSCDCYERLKPDSRDRFGEAID